MVVKGNMHIVPRVIEVAYFKSKVKIDISGYQGCLEVAMASEATKVVVNPPGHGSKINLIVPLSPMGKHWVKSAILWVTEKVMNFLASNDLLLYLMGD